MTKSEKRLVEFSTFERKAFNYIENNWLKILYYSFLVVGSVIRIYFALIAKGMFHPDEVYQSLEMAHYMVYGSAIIPPEFQLTNEVIPTYAASRSWLFPLIFAIIMRFGEALSLDYHSQTMVMIRLILAINSILIIPASKKFTYSITKNELSGVLAAIFVATSYKLVEITVRPFSNTFFLPFLFYGLARAIEVVNRNDKLTLWENFIFILCLGLVTYIRFDLGIIVFAVVVMTFKKKAIKLYLLILLDGIIGWIIGGIYDFTQYGYWFSVPINWLNFNVFEHHSDIFGVTPFGYYFYQLFIVGYLLPWFIIIIGLIGYYYLISRNKKKINSTAKMSSQVFFKFLGITLIPMLIYENPFRQTHKEVRFIMGTLVLIFCFFGYVVVNCYNLLYDELVLINLKEKGGLPTEDKMIQVKAKLSYVKPVVLFFVFLLIISQSSGGFINQFHNEAYDDINLALTDIGQQDYVKGVLVLSVWFATGGYTYLHLNDSVPMKFHTLVRSSDIPREAQWIHNDMISNIYNYFLIAYYESNNNGFIFDYLINDGWVLHKVYQGSCEVWFNPNVI